MPAKPIGEVQGPKGSEPIEHWKDAPDSPDTAIEALVWLVRRAGTPARAGAAGGVRSTVQLADVVGPTLPAASLWRTAIE